MCECSKGYTCPQHVARVNANAAGVAEQRKPKGMTIRQAVAVMKNNRSVRKVFARNEETKKAARILMGAYFSSGERGCPSLQQIVDRFSVTVAAPKAAEAAITAHKNKSFKAGDTVQVVANPGNGLTNDGWFTVGEKFVIKEAAHSQCTIKLAGKDGYWDKARFELVQPAAAQDDKWAKLVKELPMRSFTIERRTCTVSANELLRNVSTTEISEKIKDSGFKDVRPEHVHLFKPISEIGYYKILIKFNEFSKVEISLWVVPL